jgi:4-amino-4-deoxy-L-arabinose transferase-like glycosyltransferase
MTMIVSDVRRATSMRGQLVWIAWACWAVVVVFRCYLQLWRALRHPMDVATLAGVAVREMLYCAIVGAAAVVSIVAIVLIWRVVRSSAGDRALAPALLATAVLSLLWFRGQTAFLTSVSAIHSPYLPAVGEALARAASGLFGAGFIVLASWAVGELIVAALGLAQASPGERQIVALTLGFGALSMCSLAAAWAGVYRPSTVAQIIGVFLAAGATAHAVNRHRSDVEPTTAEPLFAWAAKPSGLDKAWLLLVFLSLSFAFVGALAPETEYDALWYHLNLPRLWLDAGRPVDVVQEYPSLYPMTWELVYGAGLAMGGAIAAKLLHFGCLLILATTVAMAWRLYAPSCSPWVAVGLLVTAPTVLWEATTAYDDLAIAMFASVACYALARFARTGHSSWLTASAIEFGLAASTKHLGLVALTAASAVLVWDCRRRQVAFRSVARSVITLGTVAIVLPLPWYVRAWSGSGNPFFPEMYGVFGGGPATRWDIVANQGLTAFKSHFGLGHGPAALARLPWDVTVHAALFGGSFGPLWLILIPGCLLGSRNGRGAARVGMGVLVYLAVWASPVSSFQLRFLVPVAGALALLAADGWRRLIVESDEIRLAVRQTAGIALLVVACLNLPPFTALQEADRVQYQNWLTHVMRTVPAAVVTGRESEAQYLARVLPSSSVWQYANEHLPMNAAVLTFTEGDNLYSHRTRFQYDSVLARPAIWTATSDGDVFTALQRLHIGYVIFDRRLLTRLESARLPIADEHIQRACTTLYEDRRYRLCRLASLSGGAPPRSSSTAPSAP